MILTVTLNPMLDKTVELDTLRRGAIHRSPRVSAVVGGKGVNVARQLSRLGAEVSATGLLGGETGSMLERLMTEEGLRHQFLRVAGMTREGVTYRENDGSWTAVFEPPHDVTPGEADRFLGHVLRLMEGAAWVVCSGSSPVRATDHLYAAIIAGAKKRRIYSWLDSYGEAFRQGIEAGPSVLQCNRGEIEASLSLPAATEGEIRALFGLFRRRGIERGIITDGSRAAYAGDGGRLWRADPPAVDGVNPTGSGDSLAAGILASLQRGSSFSDAFRFGVAAGAANAAKWEVADSTEREILDLLPQAALKELTPISS